MIYLINLENKFKLIKIRPKSNCILIIIRIIVLILSCNFSFIWVDGIQDGIQHKNSQNQTKNENKNYWHKV